MADLGGQGKMGNWKATEVHSNDIRDPTSISYAGEILHFCLDYFFLCQNDKFTFQKHIIKEPPGQGFHTVRELRHSILQYLCLVIQAFTWALDCRIISFN